MADIPDRGAFIVLNFDPQAGHEQAGRRIAIVLSPKDFNAKTGFIVVCPVTIRKRGIRLKWNYHPMEYSLTVLAPR